MTSLPTVSHATDDRSLRERVAKLIMDYNSGRVEDLAQALLDIADHETRLDALEDLADNDATTFLGADVALNNTANFFNGPNTGSIGASGEKWLITAVACMYATGGQSFLEAAIHNGTSYLASNRAVNAAANQTIVITSSIVVTLSAATTFTLRARSHTINTGVLLTTGGAAAVANRATSITAVRLQ